MTARGRTQFAPTMSLDFEQLYYLYLDDHDLDYIAESDAQDLEGEMGKHIADQFNLGK